MEQQANNQQTQDCHYCKGNGFLELPNGEEISCEKCKGNGFIYVDRK